MGTLFVDKLDPQSGTSLEIGSSGDTVAVPSGGKLTAPGHVLQVVQNTTTSDLSTNSTSYVASGFTQAITPSATSSKILISLHGGSIDYDIADLKVNCELYYKIGSGSYQTTGSFTRTKIGSAYGIPNSQMFLLSPSTTSEVTVQPYIKSSTSNNAYINRNSCMLTLTLSEVGA